MESDTLEVFDGKLVMINMDLDVYVKENASLSEVLSAVDTAIATFFDFQRENGSDYDKDFRISEFLSDLQCTQEGILFISFNNVSGRTFTPFAAVDQDDPCGSPPDGDDIAFDEDQKIVPIDICQIMSRGCINIRVIPT